MNFPNWWIGVSGIFFVLAIIGQLALIVLLLRMIGVLNSVKPSLEASVKKMESAAERVESAASSVKATVESVGGSTRHVAQSVETVMTAGARKLEPIAGYIGIAMTGLQIYRELRDTFGKRGQEPAEDEVEEE
jgi:hypothetical protein